jgi:acyl-CoA dehydrogenase
MSYAETISPAPPEADGFLAEIRSFLDRELTADLREAGRRTIGVHSEIGAARLWHGRLYRKGWIAPAWPVEQGGCGWSASERFLFEQECARNDAPVLFATALRSLGPLLIAVGSEEQKRRYLPRILSGEDLWCQGFSEPAAGSDLASLAIQARGDGDDYIVTGRKIWTTGAHLANRMFALVRTSRGVKPQQGISFLLIDMDSPGLTVRPIITMDGEHEFNEVIFDGVRVPKANRVGPEDEGWAVAKHLMRFARTNNTTSGLLRRAWRALGRCADEAGLRGDPGFAIRLAALEIELCAVEALELRLLGSGRLSGDDEASASLMKTAMTELHQRITTFALEAIGPLATFRSAGNGQGDPHTASHAMRKYLATRAASIYSGTNETHRNLMARHLKG